MGSISARLTPNPAAIPVTKKAGGPPNSPLTTPKTNSDGAPPTVVYEPAALITYEPMPITRAPSYSVFLSGPVVRVRAPAICSSPASTATASPSRLTDGGELAMLPGLKLIVKPVRSMSTTSVVSDASMARPSVPSPAATPIRSTNSGPSDFCTVNQVTCGVSASSAGATREPPFPATDTGEGEGDEDEDEAGAGRVNVCAEPPASTVAVSPNPGGTTVAYGTVVPPGPDGSTISPAAKARLA